MSAEDESAISSVEAAVLADQETIIAQGLKTFYAVGTALLTIRDQRLYREDHNTFEDYCRTRWGMTRTHADRMISAASVVADLTPIGVSGGSSTIVELPANEAQARPLAALPSEQRAAAWQEAVQTAPDGKVTGAHVAATVRNVQGPRPDAQQEVPDPWSEPDVDPDAGLYSLPEPPEWLHGAFVDAGYIAPTSPPPPPSPPPHDEHAELTDTILGADAALNDGGVAKHLLLSKLGRDVRHFLLTYKEDEVCAALERYPEMDHIFTDLHRLRRLIANIERRCTVIRGGQGVG